MCGICGYVDEGRFDAGLIDEMTDSMHHRGPDGRGVYITNDVALGHRRLSIIDLQGGQQPMCNEDESVWIVFNGEIYNYQELRRQLRGDHRFATESDTEVIIHLYEEYGVRCVERLRGMFAIAIWDARRQALFLARDHLGQKPLFYVQREHELLFASEIKALLVADPTLRRMDAEALHQYLTLRLVAPPRSMFAEVRKLAPGHWLLYQDGSLKIEPYWRLRYEPKLRIGENELIDELDRRLLDAVRYHMVSDVPVGAFLSGGLDSSLIVAMMSQVTEQPIKTFAGGIAYKQTNELPFPRKVADQYGTEHYAQTIAPSVIRLLPDLIWQLDEPSDPLAVSMYHIAELASRHVKVALGGDGGDELFGGYDRYYGNHYVDYYALLPEAFRKHIMSRLIDAMPDGFWYKSFRNKLNWINQMSFHRGGRRYAQSLSYFYFSDEQHDGLYGCELRRQIDDFDAVAAIHRHFDCDSAETLVDKMLLADSMVRLPDHSVMILDRTTMAHGLEARSPFLDHELFQFAASIPASFKVRGRTRRYIQMRLAQRYLPAELWRRKKQGFSSSLPYLLADEFRRLYGAFLHDAQLVRDGYLNRQPIQRMLDDYLQRKTDHANRLWLLCNAELWYRMAIKGWSRENLYECLRDDHGAEPRPHAGQVELYPHPA